MNKQTIKERIIAEYGTINKFVDKHYTEMPISRTHFYRLINGDETNPTVQTIKALAKVMNLPEEDLIKEFCDRLKEDDSERKSCEGE